MDTKVINVANEFLNLTSLTSQSSAAQLSVVSSALGVLEDLEPAAAKCENANLNLAKKEYQYNTVGYLYRGFVCKV